MLIKDTLSSVTALPVVNDCAFRNSVKVSRETAANPPEALPKLVIKVAAAALVRPTVNRVQARRCRFIMGWICCVVALRACLRSRVEV